MSLKPTIYEYCRRCGQKDAFIRGNVVWRSTHKCTNPVPGPSNPPQDFRLPDVVFVNNVEDAKP
jgi:hypothetical protein